VSTLKNATAENHEPRELPFTVEREYSFDDIDVIGGVAFDGEAIWFSDGTNHRLVRIDPATGQVLKTIDGLDVRTGTAFDGRYLWQVGTGCLLKIDPEAGTCVGSIPLATDEQVTGLSCAEGAIWVALWHAQKILEIDPESGDVQRTIDTQRFVTGIAWLGEELWHGAMDTMGPPPPGLDPDAEVRRIDPDTGRPLVRFKMPPDAGVSGVAVDRDGTFWCGDCCSGTLRAIKLGRR